MKLGEVVVGNSVAQIKHENYVGRDAIVSVKFHCGILKGKLTAKFQKLFRPYVATREIKNNTLAD